MAHTEETVREAGRMLAAGFTQKAVSSDLGIARKTIRRWASDPDFLDAFEQETLRLQRAIHARVLRSAEKAMATLEELMEDPDDARIRLGAAKTVLTAVGTTRSELGEGAGRGSVQQTVIVMGTPEGDAAIEGARARVMEARAKAVLPASARETSK